MTGGLIEIVTYGSQDLFLTGTPEITFFKIVYRRYTNFSMESIKVNFDDNVGFGLTSSLTTPKTGDLMYRTYIEIILPKIDLKRSDFSDDFKPALDQAKAEFQIVRDFMTINRQAYVGALEIFVADNNNSTEAMINKVNEVFNNVGSVETIEAFKNLLTATPDAPFTYDEVSMQSIADSFPIDEDIQVVFDALTIGIDKSIKTQKFYFDNVKEAQKAHDDESDPNIKFAWVDRVGHAIIDEIEVRIGGNKVDRQWGDWINIWYELSANRDVQETYFKMIGNVEELTSFDRVAKPQYRLQVPLPFWFCRYSGLALPLVALEYHDVTFHVKFRKLEDLSYIENGKKVYIQDTSQELFLDEVSDELGLNIDAQMVIDYVYLDSPERRRFAQASHEYLIDQIERIETSNINQPTFQCVLNRFNHPSKELIWVAQKRKYTENIDGFTQLRWDNYSLTDENKGNPIAFSTIDFHSYNRVQRLDGNYFNYVQPDQHHNTTPSDGINIYSFSLHPEEHQPTGSANLNRLSRVLLTLEFDSVLFPEDGDGEVLNVRVYTRSTNILRLISGFGSLAYTYG